MRLATSSEMKQIERNAASSGLSYYRMMENAGQRAFEFITDRCGVGSARYLVAVGTGNNGGDGLVCARLLSEAGANVSIILVGGEPKTPDSVTNYRLARELGIEIIPFEAHEKQLEAVSDADVMIEAVYGTGFHGTFRDAPVRELMRAVNRSGKRVYSLDVPAGVDSDTGSFDDDAVSADFTLCFDSLKPAHLIYPSAERCGSVHCLDIGIPDSARSGVPETFRMITEDIVFDAIPARGDDTNKGSFGKLLNIGSSRSMTGAGRLSTLGAHRVGTGLVTLAAPEEVIGIHQTALMETVFLPLSTNAAGTVSAECTSWLEQELDKYDACLIGCGLGCNEDTERVTSSVLSSTGIPVLVDADGLNSIRNTPEVLRRSGAQTALTPHPAEMARLCRCTAEEVVRNKVALGREFSGRYGAALVLKGAHTLVFDPDGTVYVNLTGNSGLAKGGSGDILSGMIAGFLAQGLTAVMSCVCGVYLHGLAADRCAGRLSKTAMLPSDILVDLCKIFLENGR